MSEKNRYVNFFLCLTLSFLLELNDLRPGNDMDTFGELSEEEMRVSLDDFSEELQNLVEISSLQHRFFEACDKIHHQNPNNLQVTCKIGFKNFHPFINPRSLVNVMSRTRYNEVMSNELGYKGNNFIGVVKNVHVFVGCYMFLADFMFLEDISEFFFFFLKGDLYGF